MWISLGWRQEGHLRLGLSWAAAGGPASLWAAAAVNTWATGEGGPFHLGR